MFQLFHKRFRIPFPIFKKICVDLKPILQPKDTHERNRGWSDSVHRKSSGLFEKTWQRWSVGHHRRIVSRQSLRRNFTNLFQNVRVHHETALWWGDDSPSTIWCWIAIGSARVSEKGVSWMYRFHGRSTLSLGDVSCEVETFISRKGIQASKHWVAVYGKSQETFHICHVRTVGISQRCCSL